MCVWREARDRTQGTKATRALVTDASLLGLPACLYFAQGLPALLREHAVSLSAIGFMAFLATPWALKFLWAPAHRALRHALALGCSR